MRILFFPTVFTSALVYRTVKRAVFGMVSCKQPVSRSSVFLPFPAADEPRAVPGGGAGARQQRLQAVVSILFIWESEALEAAAAAAAELPHGLENVDRPPPLPAVERVARLRAEASVRALVGTSSGCVPTPPAVGHAGAGASDEGTGPSAATAAAGSIVDLMQEWWPRLMSAAADAQEWDFMCR